VPLAQVLPRPNWFFISKPGFLAFIWIFSSRNHFKINISQILIPNLTKHIPLNPAHQDLSNNTKGTLHFLWNFQLRFNFIFSEDIIQYSRTFAPRLQTPRNQAHAPLLIESPSSLRAFQRQQEQSLKHPGPVDLISTNKAKQTNNLPSKTDLRHILKTCWKNELRPICQSI
jgi:hypothetical protein